MSLSTLLLAIFLILLGLSWLAILAVSAKLLGIIALVDGIAWLVESYRPIVLFDRNRRA